MEKKKYIIIGVVAAAVIAYYLYKNKQTATTTTASADLTDEEKIAQATSGSGKSVARIAEATVTAAVQTEEDEEYNLARENYRKLTGSYPPKSWTKAMIDSWIDEQEKKNEAIKKYVSLVSSSSYVTDEHTDDMTLSEVETLITKAQNQIDAGKKAERTQYITELVSKFQSTLQAPNYRLMTATKKNAWDVSVLNEMYNLSTDEKKEFNSIFAAKGGSGKIPDYFNQASSKWRNRTTVYDAIVSGNANTGRTGASTAQKVKEAYKNL